MFGLIESGADGWRLTARGRVPAGASVRVWRAYDDPRPEQIDWVAFYPQEP
jgi:hypothetical protein